MKKQYRHPEHTTNALSYSLFFAYVVRAVKDTHNDEHPTYPLNSFSHEQEEGNVLLTDVHPPFSTRLTIWLIARNFSYSPYSKFRVGAALRTVDGKIYQGKSSIAVQWS